MIDLVNQRFGRLTVTGRSHRNKKREAYWHCVCDCGASTQARGSHLKRGETQSCGCLVSETTSLRAYKHGHYANGNNNGTPTHVCWMNMVARCTNPKAVGYRHYGGRGIRVCERWFTFENFEADMGMRPSKQHSIGRVDNNGNYEPGNCRWETRQDQANNTRRNRVVTYGGVTTTVTQMARLHGQNPLRVVTRLHSGWPLDRALTTPVNQAIAASVAQAWKERRLS